jgi:hypothetical protein
MSMLPAFAVGILASLYEDERDGAVKRRIVRLIWHLPSLTWGALALAVLSARLSGSGNTMVTIVAAFIFAVSGTGNLWAHRRPFIGGILLSITAALVATDWLANR